MRLALLAAANSIHTYRWATSLADRGHDVLLVTVQAPAPDLTYPAGVQVEVVGGRPPLSYLTAGPMARRVVRRFRPDVVSVHYASGYGFLARWIRGVPTVLSVWGSDVYVFPETSALHRRLLVGNLRRCDRLTSTSEVMRRRTLEVLGPPAPHIDVIPFGVDCTTFVPAGDGHTGVTIGTVKTLAPKYGIDDLIRAFAIVADAVPDAELVVVGGGPARAELESLASSSGVADRVRFVGPVTHTEVPSWLRRFDVYAALSIEDSESFGVAVIEASATALPVVVTSVGGLPEVVADGTTGYVVPPREPATAAARILELVRDPERRTRMGRAGRDRVLDRYDWERCVDLMEVVLDGCRRGGAPERTTTTRST